MMIRAGALPTVLVITLIIGLLSTSLISVAYYYQFEARKKAVRGQLLDNLESGIAVISSEDYCCPDSVVLKDLFGEEQDTTRLFKSHWGVFEFNTVEAWKMKDTLRRCFLSGNIDTDSSAIYFVEQDRPLSLSGNTQISGDGELPKSGLIKAFVAGKQYTGNKLIDGDIRLSKRQLPVLNQQYLQDLLDLFHSPAGFPIPLGLDSVTNSFFKPVSIYRIAPQGDRLRDMKLSGKIILISDSTLQLDSTMVLQDVLVFARSIRVADGFTGSCQLFARDSIVIGKRCKLEYPSFAGVFKAENSADQVYLSLGQGSRFEGLMLSYQKKTDGLSTRIAIAKDCLVQGEVFATGIIQLEAPVRIYGKITAQNFLMEQSGIFYENYLIDVILNRRLRSKYYLRSDLITNDQTEKKILKWLN